MANVCRTTARLDTYSEWLTFFGSGTRHARFRLHDAEARGLLYSSSSGSLRSCFHLRSHSGVCNANSNWKERVAGQLGKLDGVFDVAEHWAGYAGVLVDWGAIGVAHYRNRCVLLSWHIHLWERHQGFLAFRYQGSSTNRLQDGHFAVCHRDVHYAWIRSAGFLPVQACDLSKHQRYRTLERTGA